MIDEHLSALQRLRQAIGPRAGFTPQNAEQFHRAVRGLEQWRSHIDEDRRRVQPAQAWRCSSEDDDG